MLTTSTAVPTTYTLTRPDGIFYNFALVGSSYELTEVANRAGTSYLCFNYVSLIQLPACSSATGSQNLLQQLFSINNSLLTPQLQSITDQNGRAMNFSWSGPFLSSVSFQATASGPVLTTSYTVSGDRLTQLTQAANYGGTVPRTTKFSYGASGLSGVTDQYVDPGVNTEQTANAETTSFNYSPTQLVTQTGTPALASIVDRNF